jgi:hypothetical protein
MDLTAYEYLLYQRDREKRLQFLTDGIITQGEFDEENQRVLQDIRRVKRSKIIREVCKKPNIHLQFDSENNVDQENSKKEPLHPSEIKKASLYYWLSARL